MKRYNNLFNKIYDMENLRLAHKNASRGKSHYREVKLVDSNPDYYLNKIHEILKDKTFSTSHYKIEKIHDGHKERIIHKLPYYPDRIIQWAVMLVLEDIFIKSFTKDTYSAIPNRGIHQVLQRLKRVIKEKENIKYCLKLDVKQYYPSIDHSVLKGMLNRKIKDKNVLWLLNNIIDSIPGKVGIPIGNYTSQYFANFYLSYFDHWLKEQCCIKHYYRYMDDIVILHESKTFLRELLSRIKVYFDGLHLTIKSNWQIFPSFIRGIDFIGYRVFESHTLIRKSIALKFKRKMRILKAKQILQPNDINSIMSYKGWIDWCDGRSLFEKYAGILVKT